MLYLPEEIVETIEMIGLQNLDIRTVTLGLSLMDCIERDHKRTADNIYNKIVRYGRELASIAEEVSAMYGIPIVNKRVSVTPISLVAGATDCDNYTIFAEALDRAAEELKIDFIGGFSALVEKGCTIGDRRLLDSVPEALANTSRVCSSINLASTKAGVNFDAVGEMGRIIKETARLTESAGGIGAAKLVVFANAVNDNPFMAGAFHGICEAEATLNVGISGPGVVRAALAKLDRSLPINELAEVIKKTSFKITRVGELVGREVASRLGVEFGILDLSLAPTPAVGDSVGNILEEFGLEAVGAYGTTMALAILNDAVKKGGAMAASRVGGLSGAFIPVSEDQGMIEATRKGHLTLEKLEAMTAVCSVGLDMFAIPGDTPEAIISGIIADELAIGLINNKTTAVRVIPAPGKRAGDKVSFGGLLGEAYVMDINRLDCSQFISRGGFVAPPLSSLRN